MPATLILRGKEYQVQSGMTIRHALEKCNIELQSVLATRNGELIHEEVIVQEGDLIKLVAVISGG